MAMKSPIPANPDNIPSDSLSEFGEDFSIWVSALSSPVRIKMLKIIKKNGSSSNKELSMGLGMNPANISQHLKILKYSNLIEESEKLKDNTIVLRLVPSTVKSLGRELAFLFN